MEIKKASEPSDIIWENRHITPTERFRKQIIAFFVVLMMLLASFAIIFFFATYAYRLTQKYPDVECENLLDYGDEVAMQKAAIREYGINHALARQGIEVPYQGNVQCYCDDR